MGLIGNLIKRMTEKKHRNCRGVEGRHEQLVMVKELGLDLVVIVEAPKKVQIWPKGTTAHSCLICPVYSRMRNPLCT